MWFFYLMKRFFYFIFFSTPRYDLRGIIIFLFTKSIRFFYNTMYICIQWHGFNMLLIKCNCNRNIFCFASDRFEHLAAEHDPWETSHVDSCWDLNNCMYIYKWLTCIFTYLFDLLSAIICKSLWFSQRTCSQWK